MLSPSDPEQSSTQPNQEPREGSRSEQRGLYRAGSVVLWWVLGCAAGGMLGGFGRILEMLFFLPVFFGGFLGIAQGLVLRRYLPRGIGLWILASFLGWFAGEIVRMILLAVFPAVGDVGAEAISSEQSGSPYGLDPFFVYEPVVWAVFGLAQGLVLWAVLGLRSLGLMVLWVAASSLGGVLGYFGIPERFVVGPEGPILGGGILGEIGLAAASPGILGALYGLPTGLVLARVILRGPPVEVVETPPPPGRSPGVPWYRRRGVAVLAGLVVMVVGLFLGWRFLAVLPGSSCDTEERTVLEEFSQPEGAQQAGPEEPMPATPASGETKSEPPPPEGPTLGCQVTYQIQASKEQVYEYYEEQLTTHGWTLVEPPPPEETDEPVLILAQRDNFSYEVAAFALSTGPVEITTADETDVHLRVTVWGSS